MTGHGYAQRAFEARVISVGLALCRLEMKKVTTRLQQRSRCLQASNYESLSPFSESLLPQSSSSMPEASLSRSLSQSLRCERSESSSG